MIDYLEFNRAFNRTRKHIIPNIVKDKNEFEGVRSILWKKYKKNNYYEIDRQKPILFNYFRANLIFICKHHPELVGTVAALGVNEPDYWLPDLKSYETNEPINWQNLHIHTIANAEAIFQKARKEVCDIVTNKDKLNSRIENILKGIKPLEGAEPYNDIRQIYWMLYCELRIVLQFHKQDPDWNFFFTIGEHPEHWFQLRGEADIPALKYLSEHSIEEYENKPNEFRKGLLPAVRGDCVSDSLKVAPTKIEEPKPIKYGEKQERFLDIIKLTPRNKISDELFGKEHKNKVTITKAGKIVSYQVPDEQFVYIYLLAVERKLFGNEKLIWRNVDIPQMAKDVLKSKLGITRHMKWFSDSGQKATVMSNINKKIPSLIESSEIDNKTSYTLNKKIAIDSIKI